MPSSVQGCRDRKALTGSFLEGSAPLLMNWAHRASLAAREQKTGSDLQRFAPFR